MIKSLIGLGNGVHIHPALIKGFGNIWGSHVVSAERCASVTSA